MLKSVSASGTDRMSIPPVMTWASPRATDSVPRVTISGGIFALATRNPLRNPQAAPVTSAATMPIAAVPQPSPPIPSITFAATD